MHMLELTLVIFAALICFICAYLLTTYVTSKCPGMQTLFDTFLTNSLLNHSLFVMAYCLVTFCAVIYQNWNPILARMLTIYYQLSSFNDGFALLFIPTIRYFSIFHPTVLNQFDDRVILKNCRIFGFTSSITLLGLQIFIVQNEPRYFYYMTGISKSKITYVHNIL